MANVSENQNSVTDDSCEFVSYELKKPVKNINGDLVKVVQIKTEYTGSDIETIANRGNGKDGTFSIATVSCATSLPMGVVRLMNSKDLKKILAIAQNFLEDGDSPKTE